MQADYCIKSNIVFDGQRLLEGGACIFVKDDRIIEVTPYDHGSSISDNEMKVLDYTGRLVMPGFADAHTHFYSAAIAASEHVISNLGDARSEDECAGMVYDYAVTHPTEKRIRGRGWFVTNWGNADLPTKASLDKYLPDIPVYLQAADVHSYWLNSAAIKECGITKDMTVSSGYIGMLPDGELSGLLVEEEACRPAKEKFEEFSDEELKEIYRDYMKIVASCGVTSMSEMLPSGYDEKQLHDYKMLKEFSDRGELTVRVHLYSALYDTPDFDMALAWKRLIDDDYLKLSGVKGFIDGVVETHTGLLLEPYSDRPDTCGIGVPVKPYEELLRQIIKANIAGFPVRIHCIADGSVRMALDAFEEAIWISGRKLPNTIEHIENVHPDDIRRFRKLGVIPSMQPIHVLLDNDGKIRKIGGERIKYEWPIRTMLNARGVVALGTDTPVVSIDPFENIYAATTRCFFDGRSASYNKEECLKMTEALYCYTYGGAKAYCRENEIGLLRDGYLADIIAVDKNLFRLSGAEILKTKVCMTMIGGRVVYEKD